MKSITCISKILVLTLCLSYVFTTSVYGQNTPKSFNYQAVARSNDGSPISGKKIVVEITIKKGDQCDNGGTCTSVWQEIHTPTTNEFGLFSIEIGGSSALPTGVKAVGINSFNDINWNLVAANDLYYIQVRVDFGDSQFINGLVDMGTTKLQAVPYARVSEQAQTIAKDGSGKVLLQLSELNDVQFTGLANDNFLVWNGSKWINKNFTVSGNYVKQDGTADLTGNWAISTNSITLATGSLTLNYGKMVLKNGDLDVNNGNANIGGSLYLNGSAYFNFGNLNIAQGGILVSQGNVNISTGSISMPSGSLTMLNGLMNSKSIKLGNGATITSISDVTLGSSNTALPTEAVVKTYVDNKVSPFTSNNGYVYYNGGQNVGVGTNTPLDIFHVNLTPYDGKGFLVTGAYTSSSLLPSLGAGTRMFFYPAIAAFRAGRIGGTTSKDPIKYPIPDLYWDKDYLGIYSAAFGYNNLAAGSYSFACGNDNIAFGSKSFSMGYDNIAAGINSAVFGWHNFAGAANSFCIGRNNYAGSEGSVADNAVAMGYGVKADGRQSLATGLNTTANGDNSLTLGNGTQTNTNAIGSIAAGINSQAQANYTFVFGEGLNATCYQAFVIGQYNKRGYSTDATNPFAWVATDAAFVIGNGTDASPLNRNDAFYVLKNGDVYAAGNIYANGGTLLTSDMRLKKGISTFTNALNTVIKLNGIQFYWNTDMSSVKYNTKEKQYGLIAQEVEKIIPELVAIGPDGFKKVNYIGLIPFLIEAVKEQQIQIDVLKKSNSDLKKENEENKTKIDELTKKFNELNTKIEAIEKMIKK